jgi:hypothetical protein
MADKMTGKKPKKVRVAAVVPDVVQKSGEATGSKKEVEQRKKR